MMRSRWYLPAAVLAFLAVGQMGRAAPVPADRTGLSQVPASAPLVIHVRGIEGLRDRIVAFLETALPDMAPKVKSKIDDILKDGFDGRKLAGVAKDGPIFVVFTEMPKPGVDKPKIAVVVAVTKFSDFRDGLLKEDERKALTTNAAGVAKTMIDGREAVYFVDKKGYAVVSPDEEVAASFAKKEKAGGLDAKISKTLGTKLLASDLGVYLSMDSLNKEYGDQIKAAKDGLKALIDQAAGTVGKAQKHNLEIAKKLVDPVFQGVEDSQGVLFSAEVRPNGVAIHGQTELRDGSVTSRALADFKPSSFRDLDRLPPGQMFYSGLDMNAKMLEALGSAIFGGAGEDDKQAKAIATGLKDLARAEPGARVDAASVPPRGLQIWQFQDPKKAVAAQLKMVKAIEKGGTYQTGVVIDKPDVKEDAEKYGDFTFNSVTVRWDIEKMAEQATGGQELPEEVKKGITESMKSLLGDKTNVWVGTDGKVVVQVTAKDWAAAEELLDRYFKDGKGVGTVAAFREVRKELPAGTTMLAIVDAVQYLGIIADFAKPLVGGFIPLPPGFPAKPEKETPSYVGVAVSLGAERGSFDLVISASAVRESYNVFVKPLLGLGAN